MSHASNPNTYLVNANNCIADARHIVSHALRNSMFNTQLLDLLLSDALNFIKAYAVTTSKEHELYRSIRADLTLTDLNVVIMQRNMLFAKRGMPLQHDRGMVLYIPLEPVNSGEGQPVVKACRCVGCKAVHVRRGTTCSEVRAPALCRRCWGTAFVKHTVSAPEAEEAARKGDILAGGTVEIVGRASVLLGMLRSITHALSFKKQDVVRPTSRSVESV